MIYKYFNGCKIIVFLKSHFNIGSLGHLTYFFTFDKTQKFIHFFILLRFQMCSYFNINVCEVEMQQQFYH